MNWSEAVGQVIPTIKWARYGRGDHQNGVTEHINWQSRRIFTAGNPPNSHCSGAVGEVMLKALKLLGYEDKIPVDDIQYLREHGFIYDQVTHYDSYAGAMFELGWMEDFVHEEDVEYGDIAQYWHEDNEDNDHRRNGHSVIITGKGEHKGRAIFKDWSASPVKKLQGHGYATHYVEDTLWKKFHRVWYIGRPNLDMMNERYS